MRAYSIFTYQEFHDFLGIDIFEPVTVDTKDVALLYFPKRLLLGVYLDYQNKELIISTKPPYLGAPEIVDGKRKGNVKEIELDEEKMSRLKKILTLMDNEPSFGFFGTKLAKHREEVQREVRSMVF